MKDFLQLVAILIGIFAFVLAIPWIGIIVWHNWDLADFYYKCWMSAKECKP